MHFCCSTLRPALLNSTDKAFSYTFSRNPMPKVLLTFIPQPIIFSVVRSVFIGVICGCRSRTGTGVFQRVLWFVFSIIKSVFICVHLWLLSPHGLESFKNIGISVHLLHYQICVHRCSSVALFSSTDWSLSGVIGISVTNAPVASNTAAAIAGAPPSIGSSPTPFAPKGPCAYGFSTMIVSISGASSDVG